MRSGRRLSLFTASSLLQSRIFALCAGTPCIRCGQFHANRPTEHHEMECRRDNDKSRNSRRLFILRTVEIVRFFHLARNRTNQAVQGMVSVAEGMRRVEQVLAVPPKSAKNAWWDRATLVPPYFPQQKLFPWKTSDKTRPIFASLRPCQVPSGRRDLHARANPIGQRHSTGRIVNSPVQFV